MKTPITVALLGRNPITLEGMGRILAEHDFKVVETADDPSQLESSRQATELDTHLILVENFVEMYGVEFVEKLRQEFPNAKLVLLVGQFDLETMIGCFRTGAHGYILSNISVAPLIASLRLVAMGEKVMPTFLADVLPDLSSAPTPAQTTQSLEGAGLSMREAEILQCLIAGQPNKVISRQLNISEATVKVHVKAILRKVGVQNRTQAAIWAVGEKWPDSALRKIAGAVRRPPFKYGEVAAV
jgi:two-component system nitrate/nitrite response regulator NarL